MGVKNSEKALIIKVVTKNEGDEQHTKDQWWKYVNYHTLPSGTSLYRPYKGVPPGLPSTIGWKPVKILWKICEIPCDKKTPCEKTCEFCTA